ncbi:MAG: glycoside hydrolase family 3 protein [Ruminococcaceae bacterium]|nr:glycoside hydrolase family 3 protein [Oscillospiraceae bacterium]
MTKEQAMIKARAIVAEMTVEEKASVLRHESPDIPRLGINDHNWWNEASHGVARNGMATVFPHAIAMAATFDPELMGEIGEVVSTEARAKYNSTAKHKDFDIFKNLTYWTPNINIFRDPRWGRGQETYGEDPYLTATMATNYIKGIQGNGEYLKAAACAKHFAVHSGPESTRHGFNAEVSDHDLFETYLPAFEWCVKSRVVGVMGAYNRFRGQPCCANDFLMNDILFGRWRFDGYFVSDCGAIRDIWEHHHCANSLSEAAALTLKHGCHLNCGDAYYHLMEAYEEDLITEEELTEAAVKVMSIRVLLGEFEDERPYSDIPFSKVECREHKALNLEVARECLVLLKNDGILPLDKKAGNNIAVIGPNAMSEVALEGNYNGMSGEYITVAEGMRKVFGQDNDIRVAKGSNIWVRKWNDCMGFSNMLTEGIAFAEESDVTVLVLGLDCHIEGEENEMVSEFFDKGDKKLLGLPRTQVELAEAVCDVCDNVVVVVLAGSAVDLGEKVTKHARAIIHGWYPGAVGGLAVAELLAGEYSPSGKLPLTFYKSVDDLPPFEDYNMAGRTYRYFDGDVLYPFGYGLSYTKFGYSGGKILAETDDEYEIEVTVTNTGNRDGADKVQVYGKYTDSRTPTPRYQLCGVKKVHLAPGEATTVTLRVNKYWLSAVLEDGTRVVPDGALELYVGGHQPDEKSCELCGSRPVMIKVK